MNKNISYNDIKNNEMINHYIDRANFVTGAMGYTEHSRAHATLVAETAGNILKRLNYSKREIELAKIAGYMHDIGNTIAVVCSAIGQHDERTGTAIDPISAALILADKTDVRRNRVCTKKKSDFDIHDRVNYAVKSSNLIINPNKGSVQLELNLDYSICTVMDYFEIFLGRMIMCKRAAEILGLKFKARANGTKIC